MHVVTRVEAHDHVSDNRSVTRYAYHHGYFDGPEREFRGFGLVEQWDTEELGALHDDDAAPANYDAASYRPPMLTRTWFHTGAYLDGERISRQLELEYWAEQGLDPLDDTVLPESVWLPNGTRRPYTLSPEEEREACRALRGSVLRQEIYAEDGGEAEARPYNVTESNYTLELIQPRAVNEHAVLFAHPRETISASYERALFDVDGERLPDPRVDHALTLDADRFGNLLRSAAVQYGRRHRQVEPLFTEEDHRAQERLQITTTEQAYTNPIDTDDAFRAPLPCESRAYELIGVSPEADRDGATNTFRFEELAEAVASSADGGHDLPFEDVEGEGAQAGHPYRRLIEHGRTLYRHDQMTGPLQLGTVGSLALPFRSYRLALTEGLIDSVFKRLLDGTEEDLLPDPAAVLTEGGYVRSGDEKTAGHFPSTDPDGDWWIPSNRVIHSPAPHDSAASELAHARAHFFLPYRFIDPFGETTKVSYDRYDLLIQESEDPLGNRVTVGGRTVAGALASNGNDYRVLRPRLITDPNRNRAEGVFDALGMLVGTASMGKRGARAGDSLDGFEPDLSDAEIEALMANPTSGSHDLLGRATTRFVYDLRAYELSRDDPRPKPVSTCSISRETHDSDLSTGERTRVQLELSYSDGLGRQIQTKAQAEPGPVPGRQTIASPRWVGSGWMVLDNKGRPVKQYEPFFSATHRFEFDKAIGVGRVSFRDPVGRLAGLLHPNHTYEKATFDPWRQEVWDVHDTVLVADPRTDPHLGDFFERLPQSEFLPTWHERRKNGGLGTEEQSAADKAAVHEGTPTLTYFDTVGRPFLTIAHNRFEEGGTTVTERYTTRSLTDAQGYQRELIDPKGRVAFRYDYDLLGTRIRVRTMDGGERWGLTDVLGEPIRSWDGRDQSIRRSFDPLRRPTEVRVREGAGPERLVQSITYGEGQSDPEDDNLRGRVFQVHDGAGISTSTSYDFKGNLLRQERRLASEYRRELDWGQAEQLEAGAHVHSTTYDALDRAVTMTTPDQSVVRPSFNEAGLLERVVVNLRGGPATTVLLAGIEYSARGERTLVEHGNGTRTEYEYDPETSMLVRCLIRRGSGFADDCGDPVSAPCGVQNRVYVYDAAGNVTHVRDQAQQTVFFNNKRVDPSAEYTYDALYRLIEATGREHIGQSAPVPTSDDDAPRVGLAHPADGNALGRYVERYRYDEADGLLEHQHRGSDPTNPGWTRRFSYDEPSPLEPGKRSNRLTGTRIGSGPVQGYTHDENGNLTAMPHLPLMRWDHLDRLQATARQVVGAGATPETTYHVHSESGERYRKVTDRQAAAGATPTRMKERVYLGALEVYREYDATGTGVTLERESLHVSDGEERIATIETRTQGDDGSPAQLIRYSHVDQVGSATLELDSSCQVISYEEYYPYGGTALQTVRSQLEAPNRTRWSGRERDEESGFYHLGARHYVPWLGRWVSPDPAGPRGGVNPFTYAQANPLLYEDPGGTLPKPKLPKIKAKPKVKPPPAPTGTGSQYGKKSPSLYENGKRVSEDEHIRSYGEQTRDIKVSETSDVPAVSRKDYREQWTLRIPEDMARTKTAEDLRIQRAIEKSRETGVLPEDLRKQSTSEGLIERMKRARDQTRAERQAAGKPTKDLDAITDDEIERSVALQLAQLHGAGKRQDWKGVQAVIDDALKTLEGGGKVGAAAIILLPVLASAEASASPTGNLPPPPQEVVSQPLPSYIEGVDKQLSVARQVTEVMVEDSPSDMLSVGSALTTLVPLSDKLAHNAAQLELLKPGMVMIENEPYMFNTKTGELFRIGLGGVLESAGKLAPAVAFRDLWGGAGDKIVWKENDKYFLMPQEK